jgi:hypothetical protein
MALTTLSFLITTPEAWVPALGDANHGFPYLSGVGRLIVKDSIMLGAAVLLHEVAFGWPRGIEYSNPRRRLPDTFRCKIHNERVRHRPFLRVDYSKLDISGSAP